VKPKVFKIAGFWIWQCNNGHHGTVGEEYKNVRDPWSVALSMANKHADLYHSNTHGESLGYLEWRDV
jgi:hypothetical protein